MSTVIFPRFGDSDASWDFLVSCALLTTKARQGTRLMISLLTAWIQMVCTCIRKRRLPYKTRLAVNICIAISFAKTQGKVIRRLSIVSFQPNCVVTCTYSTEVYFRLCFPVASRHCFVSRSVLVVREKIIVRQHTRLISLVCSIMVKITYRWKQTKSPEH